jgi:hypothetical protein
VAFLGCKMADWVGDGNCDDTLNNEDCSYDGGDCCLSHVVDQFCIDCICHQSALNGCQELEMSTGLLGDNSHALLNSLEDCTLYCFEDSQCYAVTWDPDFNSGLTAYNCGKYKMDNLLCTNELGLTTVRCSSIIGKVTKTTRHKTTTNHS